MIIGIGCDLCKVERIKRACASGEFKERVFAPEEIAYCTKRGAGSYLSFAARFAAKEACGKALGTGISLGTLREMVVVRKEEGPPRLVLTGATLIKAQKLGVTHIHLSLSHEGDLAMAYVVLEG